MEGSQEIHYRDNERNRKTKSVKVITYGTLRKGGYFQRIIEQMFPGVGKLIKTVKVDGWIMYDLINFPCVIEGNGSFVGEIWEFSGSNETIEALLSRLDLIEGAPNLYKRETINIDGVKDNVYIYVWNREVPETAEVITDWLNK